jgi:hypothetical protein
MLNAILLSVTAPKIQIVEIPKNHFLLMFQLKIEKKIFCSKNGATTFSITALGIMTFNKATFSKTTLSWMTFGIMDLFVTLGIKVTRHYDFKHNGIQHIRHSA